jgi:hypothetical protein
METEELIHALVADNEAEGPPVGRQIAIALALGFALSAFLFLVTLGPRPDIMEALATPRFVLKIVESLLLAAAAAPLLIKLSRPGEEMRGARLALLVAPALLAATVVAELLLIAPQDWATRLVGTNSMVCLPSIPFLSLPLLVAALYVQGRLAPTRPALAGAVAGLFASGLGAALYALHCPDDSPLFVATWYSIAIAAVSFVGARAGRRFLRW